MISFSLLIYVYVGDCRRLAYPLVMAMASFSDVYDGSYFSRLKKVANSLFGIKYTLDADHLAQKVFQSVREKPIEFTKTFYNVSEMDFLARSGKKQAAQIKANVVIKIPPERMKIRNTQGTSTWLENKACYVYDLSRSLLGAFYQVPVPSSHLGSNLPVQVRLISPFRTQDMIGSCPCAPTAIAK